MASIVRRALDKYAFWRWHTRRGWPIASAYARHWKACQESFRAHGGAKTTSVALADASSFRRNGWLVLAADEARADLAASFHRQFEAMIVSGHCDVVTGEGDGLPLVRLHCADRHMPKLVDLLDQTRVRDALTTWYGSHFKVHTAYVYRLLPSVRKASESWLWHTDDVPPGSIKVMVYFNETKAENGAFRAVGAKLSWRILRDGFYDRERAERFIPTLERATVVFEGGPGTVVVFDNNILHKATAPSHGFRDAVVFTLLPSKSIDVRSHWAAHVGTLSGELRPKTPEDPSLE